MLDGHSLTNKNGETVFDYQTKQALDRWTSKIFFFVEDPHLNSLGNQVGIDFVLKSCFIKDIPWVLKTYEFVRMGGENNNYPIFKTKPIVGE